MDILGLLDLPHFGRGKYARICIKQLIAVTHGGDIWLDNIISIDVDITMKFIGFPSWGMDPTQFLDDKTKEKELAKEMKNKYGTYKGTQGIIIKRINDVTKQMATKILACNLLRKCHREEVLTGVILVAAQCTEGTIVDWAPYLLNLFLDD
jgi:hypothetical protein